MTVTETLYVAIGFVLASVHCKVLAWHACADVCMDDVKICIYSYFLLEQVTTTPLIRMHDPNNGYPHHFCDLNDDEYGRPYLGSFDQYLSNPASVFPVITAPRNCNVTLAEQAADAVAHIHRREKHQAQFTLPACITYNECELSQGIILYINRIMCVYAVCKCVYTQFLLVYLHCTYRSMLIASMCARAACKALNSAR